jgi:uncharacterized protein YjbI with pentapeptide repeats
VELPSIKPRSKSRRQGLRKLSPDLISKARDETATQVTRIGLTFLGTTAFCLLSLLSPDSALLGGNEKIIVPLAGPVSFFGFMLLGPTVLIVLRVYLQIYVEHSDRLDRLARSVSVVRAPTLVPLRNPLIRVLSGLTFYLLLPVAMMLFAWKAAVFSTWGEGLLCVATGVVVSHVMLPFSKFSWRSKALLSVTAAIITGGLLLGFGPMRRPFDLYHANLSGQELTGLDLRNANLSTANLSNTTGSKVNLTGADLIVANLSRAYLIDINLTGADLTGATLSNANLTGSNLSDANLTAARLSRAILLAANLSATNLRGADLSGADLSGANLSAANLRGAKLSGATLFAAKLSAAKLSDADLHDAKNLTQTQLDEACGNANTKLPEGLTLKPCSTD